MLKHPAQRVLYEKRTKLQAIAAFYSRALPLKQNDNDQMNKMTQTDRPTPLNIAHRGGADLWPENTLEAFARAIQLGVDGLEFDIQLSKDGILVIHHDAVLKAEATRRDGGFLKKPTPRIDALTLDDMQAYDVGTLQADSPYGRRRAGRANMDGLKIPTLAALETLVAEIAPDNFTLYTELKTDMGANAGQAQRLADAYLSHLDSSPLSDRHCVVSFDWRALNRVRAARPDIAHAYTTLEFSATDPAHKSAAQDNGLAAAIRAASANGAPWFDGFDWRDMQGDTHGEKILAAIDACGGTGWFAYWQDIDPARMAQAQKLGLQVSAWTVNEAANMTRLNALGVGALITDRPDILKKL